MATIVVGGFEWDADKAESNSRKHRVSFAEAVTALEDPDAMTGPDLVEPSRRVTKRADGWCKRSARELAQEPLVLLDQRLQ